MAFLDNLGNIYLLQSSLMVFGRKAHVFLFSVFCFNLGYICFFKIKFDDFWYKSTRFLIFVSAHRSTSVNVGFFVCRCWFLLNFKNLEVFAFSDNLGHIYLLKPSLMIFGRKAHVFLFLFLIIHQQCQKM